MTRPNRNGLLAMIHIAKADMHLGDAEYRMFLRQVTGKDSAADCTDAQLDAMVRAFKVKGWKPKRATKKSPRTRDKAAPTMLDKARALWIGLHNDGVVRTGSEQALNAYVKRRFKVDNVGWLKPGQLYSLVEGLKAWGARERLRAEWRRGHEAGVIGDGSDEALAAWCERPISRLTYAEATGLSTRLFNWLDRHGA